MLSILLEYILYKSNPQAVTQVWKITIELPLSIIDSLDLATTYIKVPNKHANIFFNYVI